MAVRNDLAIIMQTHGKIAILPHEDATEYAVFDDIEMTAMLALYSSFLREHLPTTQMSAANKETNDDN